jgi:hypothetical protein
MVDTSHFSYERQDQEKCVNQRLKGITAGKAEVGGCNEQKGNTFGTVWNESSVNATHLCKDGAKKYL